MEGELDWLNKQVGTDHFTGKERYQRVSVNLLGHGWNFQT